MFGLNPLMKSEQGDGNTLHVVNGSPFYTIQGEGPYTGHPAIFIRLHGCNLACTFCDTHFSDPADRYVNIIDLVHDVDKTGPTRLAVITGGEPLRQNIIPLCIHLFDKGYLIQIETAGTLWLDGLEKFTKIVCSPKTHKIHPKIFQHASAFKYVISADMKFDKFVPITATQANARPAKLAEPRPRALVYLSPMDEYNADKNTANQTQVAELAMRYNCIAGVQLHKILNITEPS